MLSPLSISNFPKVTTHGDYRLPVGNHTAPQYSHNYFTPVIFAIIIAKKEGEVQLKEDFFTFSLINVIIAIIEFRECHILPEWLLIYKIDEDILILALTRTENHSDLC